MPLAADDEYLPSSGSDNSHASQGSTQGSARLPLRQDGLRSDASKAQELRRIFGSSSDDDDDDEDVPLSARLSQEDIDTERVPVADAIIVGSQRSDVVPGNDGVDVTLGPGDNLYLADTEILKMKVLDLKAACKLRNLLGSANKAHLQHRLRRLCRHIPWDTRLHPVAPKPSAVQHCSERPVTRRTTSTRS